MKLAKLGLVKNTFVLAWFIGICGSGFASPVTLDDFSCSGTSTLIVPQQRELDLLGVLAIQEGTTRDHALHEMLRNRLDMEGEREDQQATLDLIRRFLWFRDFSQFQDEFRSCQEEIEKDCADFYVENQLIFGSRRGKVDFLSKALLNPATDNDQRIEMDGFLVHITAIEASNWVRVLGLKELWSLGAATVPNEKFFHHYLELWGTNDGEDHPVEIIAERLDSMPSSEIIARILDGDEAFISGISSFQSLLTIHGIAMEREIADSTYLPLLMCPLSRAYIWFLENPPDPTTQDISSINEYLRLKSRVEYTLGGGCKGRSIMRQAFPTFGAETATLKKYNDKVNAWFPPERRTRTPVSLD